MGRRTTRIPIYTGNPQEMNDLVKDIWEKHLSMGASSPLLNNPLIDMTLFGNLKTEALAKREEAERLYAEAQGVMEQWRVLMGIDKGQTIDSVDTLYYLVSQIKRYLLVKHPLTPESLSPWGFKVVVRMSKSPVRKKKSAKKGDGKK
jgi:hypothetical protein